MGNIVNHDGPLPASWHKEQIALRTGILHRMKSLGMTPICPVFPVSFPGESSAFIRKRSFTGWGWGGWPQKTTPIFFLRKTPFSLK